MILITGGAYQGKLEYAKSEFEFGDDDIFDCTIVCATATCAPAAPESSADKESSCGCRNVELRRDEAARRAVKEPWIDWDAKVLSHFERYVLACVDAGIDSRKYLSVNIESFRDKIIIADDITQGVVPIDARERAWREETGKCLVFLGKKAERVIRVFCGIARDIKDVEK